MKKNSFSHFPVKRLNMYNEKGLITIYCVFYAVLLVYDIEIRLFQLATKILIFFKYFSVKLKDINLFV